MAMVFRECGAGHSRAKMCGRSAMVVRVGAILLLLTLPTALVGEDNYETAAIGRRLIDGYLRDIGEASGNVCKALDVAVAGQLGEAGKWQQLATQVDRYEQVVNHSLGAVDRQVRSMVAAAPGVELPQLSIINPFPTYLERARTRIAEIKRAQIENDRRAAAIDQEVAKFRGAIVSSTRVAFAETIEEFIPNESELLGEAGVAVFGAYFGPPGILASGLAGGATFTFNQVASLYYSSYALAEQAKAFGSMVQILQTRRRELDDARASYGPALTEMCMVEQALAQYDSRVAALGKQAGRLMGNWTTLAGDAVRKRAREAAERYAQARLQQPSAVRLYVPRGTWAPTAAPIVAGEYMDEANTLLEPLRQAFVSVVSGGSPSVFASAQSTGSGIATARAEEASLAWRDASARLDQLTEQFTNVTLPAIHARYLAMLPMRCIHCELANDDVRRANDAQESAANAEAQRALEVARRPLAAQAQAAVDCQRELVRRRLVVDSFTEGASLLEAAMADHARLVVGQIGHERWVWSRQWQAQNEAYWLAFGQALQVDQLASLDVSVEELNGTIANSADGEKTLTALISDIEGRLALIETLQPRVAAAWAVVDQAYAGLVGVGAQAAAQLGGLIGRHAALLRWYSAAGFAELADIPAGFVPFEPVVRSTTDVGALRDSLQQRLVYLRELSERLEFYTGRLEVAVFRISRDLVDGLDLTLYGAKPAVAELFVGPTWVPVSAAIDQGIPAALRQVDGRALGNWSELMPRTRLEVALQAALALASTPGRSAEALAEQRRWWIALVAAVQSYDAVAVPELQRATILGDAVAAPVAPVVGAYRQLPQSLQRLVAERHQRFTTAVSKVQALIADYQAALAPLAASAAALSLRERVAEDGPGRRVADGPPPPPQSGTGGPQQGGTGGPQPGGTGDARVGGPQQGGTGDAREGGGPQGADDTAGKVNAFYVRFAHHYRQRDAAAVVAMLADDWQAADGTTLADLETTLANSFRVFDQVECTVSDLRVAPGDAPGLVRVEYQIAIKGRVHRTKIENTERSQVVDLLRLTGGDMRIVRTLAGRYWQPQ